MDISCLLLCQIHGIYICYNSDIGGFYMADDFIQPKIEPLGDTAILVSFGDQISTDIHQAIQNFFYKMAVAPFFWMIEAVPAYTSVAIYYDPLKLAQEESPYKKAKRDIELFLKQVYVTEERFKRTQTVSIPVCYGGEYGPDLAEVANHTGLTPKEVIALHTEGEYLVHMIGFAPGFPYLGGMTKKLATPRRETPRLKIPAGSVGIAGGQTGVYPLESPGGWQIIGCSPLPLFRPQHEKPSLLNAGDRVQFYSISAEEFESWSGDQNDN